MAFLPLEIPGLLEKPHPVDTLDLVGVDSLVEEIPLGEEENLAAENLVEESLVVVGILRLQTEGHWDILLDLFKKN